MIRNFKIYIIAGEASGDLHGAELVKRFKELNPDISVRGWGGDRLVDAGAHIDIRYEKTNFMGFSEVLKNIVKILGFFRTTKKIILDWKPDCLLLIDYPGFNLRMASWAFDHNIPVYYYIAPQVWAWKESRVKKLKRNLRNLYVILPFEQEYFKKHGMNVHYYGHPLVERIKNFKFNPNFRLKNNLSNQSIVALLPGSRKQEINSMLPVFLESLKDESSFQIVIAGLKQHKLMYESHLEKSKIKATVVYDDAYNLLHQSHHALVTSGTATLETALFNVPEIVCYKGNQFSYYLAKKLIKVNYISLANLIVNRKIVPEMIQQNCNAQSIRKELNFLKDPKVRLEMKADLKQLAGLLDGKDCYNQVAQHILTDLEEFKYGPPQ
ncbi:MAG: lipid-A-disaccharide synthase [Saprospiraceae bacterium]|nr:lipid-A-disaccharide synthase [Saprospiraceae bacterium]